MNLTRWHRLMKAMNLPESNACFEALVKAYSEKHRHYHTTAHIEAMLRHIDDAMDLAKHSTEVELAIWFHDAIYHPYSSTNELDSADWAVEFLSEHGCASEVKGRIHGLIMATTHDSDVKAADPRLLVDIDLSILGSQPHVYDEFEKNVRKEYRWVPGLIYRKKRRVLLQSFLSKDQIYFLPVFVERFENNARLNLQRAIDSLS